MEEPKNDALDSLPGWLMVSVCILFLIFSVGTGMSLNSTLGRTIYYLIFFLPNVFAGQYLAGKMFSRDRGLSISKASFSPLRIFVGVCLVLALFILVYGTAIFLRLPILP